MSRDISSKCNIEANNSKSNAVNKSIRSLLTDKESSNGSQTNDQPSLLLSRIKNSTNKVVLQDASTGKSATVHLKTIAKSSGDKTLSHVQQVQYVQGIKSSNVSSQIKPQIVYIKSNNLTSNTVLRPSSSVPSLISSVIKPINKVSVIKAKPSNISQVVKNPIIITSAASHVNTSLNNYDTKASNENIEHIKTSSPTNVAILNRQKLVVGSHVNSLAKVQNSVVGLSNTKSQMLNKGPIFNFKIADGKFNQSGISLSSNNSNNESKVLNLPPLQPIQKDRNSLITKGYNCAKIENDTSAKAADGSIFNNLNSSSHGLTSILKKHLGSNNKQIEMTTEKSLDNLKKLTCSINKVNDVIKIPKPDDAKQSKIEKNSNAINEEIINDTKQVAMPQLKAQPRVKKQQLQVKEDREEELCIEVLKTKQRRESKRKNKPIMKKNTNETLDDPIKNLLWKDGIGTLDDTNLHFRKNEFGIYDLLSEMEYDALTTGRKDSKYYTPLAKRTEIQVVKQSTSSEDLYECYTCASTGPAIEFISPEFCSTVCADIYRDHRGQMSKDDDSLNHQKRNQIVISDDSDTEYEERNSRYSWMPTSTRGFSWSKYMNFKKTKPAPIKLFKEPFPYHANGFKIGMKLEGIDPKHESFICVMSVVDIKGYRICLHFDSYSTKFDFWVNADSNNIFPPGWCEKNNLVLQVPKHYTLETFNWQTYLRKCRSVPAPKTLFPHLAFETVCPLGFRIGMKLEALDRKNSKEMCVASITNVLVTQRFLVHFDGRNEMYDYWADAASPYVHPVGWCQEHKEKLLPPPNCTDINPFDWTAYLNETKSIAVPSRAFKARPMSSFQVGMKLEAVDPKVPYIIRVATVAEVKENSIKVSFDGWPPRYSIWVDTDSTDIHPVGWCTKTGHPLEPPLMPDDVQISLSVGCGVPGCNGQGNINIPHQSKHSSISLCPFAPKNLYLHLEKGWDRLSSSDHEEAQLSASVLLKTNFKRRNNSETCYGNGTKRPRTTSSESSNNDSTNADDSSVISIRSETCNDDSNTCDSSNAVMTVNNPELKRVPNMINKVEVKPKIHTSVFKPNMLAACSEIDNDLWIKYTKPLSYVIRKSYKDLDPRLWSSTDVAKFVRNIPNCSSYAKIFEEQQIDGECFVMLTTKDLISYCNLRVGPAIKIYNSIMILRQQMSM